MINGTRRRCVGPSPQAPRLNYIHTSNILIIKDKSGAQFPIKTFLIKLSQLHPSLRGMLPKTHPNRACVVVRCASAWLTPSPVRRVSWSIRRSLKGGRALLSALSRASHSCNTWPRLPATAPRHASLGAEPVPQPKMTAVITRVWVLSQFHSPR